MCDRIAEFLITSVWPTRKPTTCGTKWQFLLSRVTLAAAAPRELRIHLHLAAHPNHDVGKASTLGNDEVFLHQWKLPAKRLTSATFTLRNRGSDTIVDKPAFDRAPSVVPLTIDARFAGARRSQQCDSRRKPECRSAL